MPRRDGTGPAGKGPRTGRGAGGCPPATPTRRRVWGSGLGRGMGRRRRAVE